MLIRNKRPYGYRIECRVTDNAVLFLSAQKDSLDSLADRALVLTYAEMTALVNWWGKDVPDSESIDVLGDETKT